MEKLTVLCVPLSALGHMNATLGLATALRKRGHKVVFAVERYWQGTFATLGFDEEVYDEKPDIDEVSGNQLNEFTVKMVETLRKSALDAYQFVVEGYNVFIDQTKNSNSQIEEMVKKWKPNVIIEDRFTPMPALITSTVPLIKLFSPNPLFAFDDERLPPAFLGLPIKDESDWKRCRQITREMKKDKVRQVNEWLNAVDNSIPKLDINRESISTNLNIFIYPKTLVEDYVKRCPLGDEWMRLDSCLRDSTGTFEVPPQLINRTGKLIFLSLGSIGSSLVELMKRLVSFLSKSKHNFIVVKGNSHNQYELAENMWGEPFLPQLDILPLVDLVITHGGNNTLVESLYFGKPMIVLPLFADQHDNAQRAVEMNVGCKFNPFSVEEKELNDAIDEMLLDSNVAENVRKISKEMQESDCMQKVIERIEYIAKHPKFPTITGILQ